MSIDQNQPSVQTSLNKNYHTAAPSAQFELVSFQSINNWFLTLPVFFKPNNTDSVCIIITPDIFHHMNFGLNMSVKILGECLGIKEHEVENFFIYTQIHPVESPYFKCPLPVPFLNYNQIVINVKKETCLEDTNEFAITDVIDTKQVKLQLMKSEWKQILAKEQQIKDLEKTITGQISTINRHDRPLNRKELEITNAREKTDWESICGELRREKTKLENALKSIGIWAGTQTAQNRRQVEEIYETQIAKDILPQNPEQISALFATQKRHAVEMHSKTNSISTAARNTISRAEVAQANIRSKLRAQDKKF